VVNRDVKPYALMLGVPARQSGWMSQFGENIKLPVSGHGEYLCLKTKIFYKLQDDKLEIKKTEH